MKLGEVAEINPRTDNLEEEFVYVDLDAVEKGTLLRKKPMKKENAPSRAQRVLKHNDILFQSVRSYQMNHFLYHVSDENQWVASTGYAQIRAFGDPSFLYYTLYTPSFNTEVSDRSTGSNYPAINQDELKRIPLRLPSLAEQKKIAALLSLIDERIEVQNAICNYLESLIVGFYSSVQYVTKAGWHKVRLKDLLTIRKEQNTSGSYEVYSVSVSRGIVNQIVHLGRSFAAANTSNYGVVHSGDLVYTKSPTGQFPFGIVKQNHNASPVAVSPLYGVYRPISPEVGTLLHYFFLSPLRANNYLAPLIQKGAKNTINIRTDHFLDNVVLLPKEEKELRCIADCLLALDERLSVEKEYAEQLKQQKAYLLRQMFI
mgnify:CR=1 FL=1